MLKRIWASLATVMIGAACLLGNTAHADTSQIDKTDPYAMMKQVADHTFKRLKNEQGKIKQDPNYLKTVVNEELMPYVNYQYAALKLLGKNLRGAEREDVYTFIKAFREYLVTSYAQVLTEYQDQEIKFGPAPSLDADQRITTVKVSIVDAPQPDINLAFQLRKDSKTDEWQAYDMVAEGISLLSSKRSEWEGKIRQEGIVNVAKELESLAKQPITFGEKS